MGQSHERGSLRFEVGIATLSTGPPHQGPDFWDFESNEDEA